jgi:iron complex outermembrane receptor protein
VPASDQLANNLKGDFMNPRFRLLGTAALCALTLGAAPAFAQNQQQGQRATALEEIVVTAERRTASVQNVPIAVSAFSASELERRQINETLDLVRYIPNLVGHNNTGLGSANSYYLRGLGNTETIATFDPPVGTYVDDVYMTRQNANNFSFFDVERIEVLRSPQGTLFGRNTTGGAINVIMKKPGEEFGGFAEIGYGRFDRVLARASVDAPISPKFLTKISAFFFDDKGWVKNPVTNERLNDEKSYGIRGAVRGLFSDSVTWDVAVDYMDYFGANMVNGQSADGRISRTFISRRDCAGSYFTKAVTGCDMGNTTKSLNIYSNLNVETDFGTIAFITGYRDLQQDFVLDFIPQFAGVPTAFVLGNDGNHDQFTQEIKLNGSLGDGLIDYVAGVFYINEKNRTLFADVSFSAARVATPLFNRQLRNTTEAAAGYVQADFNVTDQFKLTAGIRYTDETKEVAIQALPGGVLPPFSTANILALGIPDKLKTTLWTPRFAANHQVNDDVLLFASVTRGFKSGGWNARATSAALFPTFAPEKIWSYEGGIKSEWLDNRLRFNATAFYAKTSDLQTPTNLAPPGANPVFATGNFADLENKGIELEVQAVPLDGLTLYGTIGLQDAEYTGVPARGTGGIYQIDGSIADPVRSPDFTMTLGFNYDYPVEALRGSVITSANVQYTEAYNMAVSGLPSGLSKARWEWSGSVGYQTEDNAWSVTLECDNCTGVAYGTSFFIAKYLNRPSTWMVRGKYNF